MRSMHLEFMPRRISKLSRVNTVLLGMFDFVCCVVMMVVVYMILGWLGVPALWILHQVQNDGPGLSCYHPRL